MILSVKSYVYAGYCSLKCGECSGLAVTSDTFYHHTRIFVKIAEMGVSCRILLINLNETTGFV